MPSSETGRATVGLMSSWQLSINTLPALALVGYANVRLCLTLSGGLFLSLWVDIKSPLVLKVAAKS